MLIRYVRLGNHPIGCVVALSKDAIGWSQCCPKDRFNKKMGRKIAIQRAQCQLENKECHSKPVITKYKLWAKRQSKLDGPHDEQLTTVWEDLMTPAIDKMKERASKYFK